MVNSELGTVKLLKLGIHISGKCRKVGIAILGNVLKLRTTCHRLLAGDKTTIETLRLLKKTYGSWACLIIQDTYFFWIIVGPIHQIKSWCLIVVPFLHVISHNQHGLIQPMDQGVIRSLKASYKHDLMQQMISSELGQCEFQSCFNIKDALFSVATAWNSVKTETLTKAWSNLMANTIGDLMNDFDTSMQEQIEDENSAGRQFFLETVKFIAQSSQHQNLEPTDAHDWITEKTNEDAAAQFLNIENIQCITNHNSNDSSESSTNFGGDGLKVSWKDAENAMDTLIKFVEQTPDCTI